MSVTKSSLAFVNSVSAVNKDSEQRDQKRVKTINHEATIFSQGVISLSSDVEDISSGGAMLVANSNCQAIEEDIQLTLTIQSAGKKLTRHAVVRWVDSSAGDMRFGVEYIDHVNLQPDNHQLDIEQIKIDPACTLLVPASVLFDVRFCLF